MLRIPFPVCCLTFYLVCAIYDYIEVLNLIYQIYQYFLNREVFCVLSNPEVITIFTFSSIHILL